MDTTALAALNGPMSVTAILVNIFFCFCLLSPGDQNETLKQPLKVLLISLVTSNICLQITVFIYLIKIFFPHIFDVVLAIFLIADCSGYISMSSCMWLSIFYYTKIVQSQRAIFVWMKRSIKSIVCSGLLVDGFIIVTITALKISYTLSGNITGNLSNFSGLVNVEANTLLSIESLEVTHMLFLIILMGVSWSSTLVYLHRHMKRMERSDSPFSSSRLRSQLRVTIMGIIQTALSLLFFFFSFLYWYYLGQYDKDGYFYQAIVLSFSFGTTLNLGLNQSLLRKRAADMFNKVCPIVRMQAPVQ